MLDHETIHTERVAIAGYRHSRFIKKIDLADQAGESPDRNAGKTECREVAKPVPRIFDSVVSWH